MKFQNPSFKSDGRTDKPKAICSTLFKSWEHKNLTEPGLEPTTSGLEKPALLSTRLNTIKAITN